MEEQQASALLRVAIVLEINLECVEEVRLVGPIVLGELLESGVQLSLERDRLLDFGHECRKGWRLRRVSSFGGGDLFILCYQSILSFKRSKYIY